jgi:hypothetical protein
MVTRYETYAKDQVNKYAFHPAAPEKAARLVYIRVQLPVKSMRKRAIRQHRYNISRGFTESIMSRAMIRGGLKTCAPV